MRRRFTTQHAELAERAKFLPMNMLLGTRERIKKPIAYKPRPLATLNKTWQQMGSTAEATGRVMGATGSLYNEYVYGRSWGKAFAGSDANIPVYDRAKGVLLGLTAFPVGTSLAAGAVVTQATIGAAVGAGALVAGSTKAAVEASKLGLDLAVVTAQNTPAAVAYASQHVDSAIDDAAQYTTQQATDYFKQMESAVPKLWRDYANRTRDYWSENWSANNTEAGASFIKGTGLAFEGIGYGLLTAWTPATTLLAGTSAVAMEAIRTTKEATKVAATAAVAVAKATTIPGMLLGRKQYIAPGEFGPVVKRRPFFTTPETYQDVFGKGLAAINDEKQLALNEEYRTKASKLSNDPKKNSAELKGLKTEYDRKTEELDQAARTSMPTSLMDLLNYNARLKIEDAKRNGTKLEPNDALDQAIAEAQTSANLKPEDPSFNLLNEFNLVRSNTPLGTVTTKPNGNFSYTNEALDNKKKVMRKLLKEALDADKQLVVGENGNMAIQDNDKSSAGIKTWNKAIKLTKDDIKLFGTMSQDLDNQLKAGKQILAGLQAQQTALLAMEKHAAKQKQLLDELDKKADELKEALDELSEKRQLLSANKEGGIQKTDLSTGELIEAVGDLAVDIETGNDGRLSITPNLNKLKPKLSADEKSKLSSYMNHVDKSNLQGFLNTIFEREINKALKSIGKAQTKKHANSHIATLEKYNKALKTAMQDPKSINDTIGNKDPQETQERQKAWQMAAHAAKTSSKKTTAAIKKHEKTLEKKVENTQRLTKEDFGGENVFGDAELDDAYSKLTEHKKGLFKENVDEEPPTRRVDGTAAGGGKIELQGMSTDKAQPPASHPDSNSPNNPFGSIGDNSL